MALSDDQLLDFDTEQYASYDEGKAHEALAGEHGDAYRAGRSEDWVQGWEDALREVAARLRQGDLIPGGFLYTDATGTWDEPH